MAQHSQLAVRALQNLRNRVVLPLIVSGLGGQDRFFISWRQRLRYRRAFRDHAELALEFFDVHELRLAVFLCEAPYDHVHLLDNALVVQALFICGLSHLMVGRNHCEIKRRPPYSDYAGST